MPAFLPPCLLALFEARDPLPYLPPVDELICEKKTQGYSGIASFVNEFEDPKDTPPPTKIETKEEREEKKRCEKAEQTVYKLEQDLALWTPRNNPAATADPYKTLFVGRLNYDTSKSKLRREFEEFGAISKIIIVHNKTTGRPRGYAFIEYERQKDMHAAYKCADGRKIDGRRIVVDIERGRTIEGWRPRRLGGGLGGRRKQEPDAANPEYDEDRNRERDRDEMSERLRGRSRDRHRRSRSRNRYNDRHIRERSGDRHRGRDFEAAPNAMNEVERWKTSRSRSTERDRKRRRSRSKDRYDRRDYDRGDRDSGRRDRNDRDIGRRDRDDRDIRRRDRDDRDIGRRDRDDRDIGRRYGDHKDIGRRDRFDTDERVWDEGKMMDEDNRGDLNRNCEGDFSNYIGPEEGYGVY